MQQLRQILHFGKTKKKKSKQKCADLKSTYQRASRSMYSFRMCYLKEFRFYQISACNKLFKHFWGNQNSVPLREHWKTCAVNFFTF